MCRSRSAPASRPPDGGLNNRIGVIRHRAYGFDSFAALAAMVFPCCVDLQLKLPFA